MSGQRAAFIVLGGLLVVAVGACGNDEPATFDGLDVAGSTTTVADTTTTEALSLVEAPAGYTQDQADAALKEMAVYWADAGSDLPDWPQLDGEIADYVVEAAAALCSDIDNMADPTAGDLVDSLDVIYDVHIDFFADAGMGPNASRFGARTFVETIAGPGALHFCPDSSMLLATAGLLWLDGLS